MASKKIKKYKRITLTLERFKGSELRQVLKQLLSDLANAPDEVRNRALGFLDFTSELVSLEAGVTSGATVPILIKPSNFLLNLCTAVRAGNFDLCVIEHSHSFSFVGNGLVELPILPISGRLLDDE